MGVTVPGCRKGDRYYCYSLPNCSSLPLGHSLTRKETAGKISARKSAQSPHCNKAMRWWQQVLIRCSERISSRCDGCNPHSWLFNAAPCGCMQPTRRQSSVNWELQSRLLPLRSSNRKVACHPAKFYLQFCEFPCLSKVLFSWWWSVSGEVWVRVWMETLGECRGWLVDFFFGFSSSSWFKCRANP